MQLPISDQCNLSHNIATFQSYCTLSAENSHLVPIARVICGYEV